MCEVIQFLKWLLMPVAGFCIVMVFFAVIPCAATCSLKIIALALSIEKTLL